MFGKTLPTIIGALAVSVLMIFPGPPAQGAAQVTLLHTNSVSGYLFACPS